MNNINIDEINKMFSEQKGFISNNNIKVEEVKENYAKLSSTIEEKSLNPYGIVHGGLLFGLADTAMGIAAKTTGQNAVLQAKEFKEASKITGLILTKLDGTAKGGIIISIRKELGIPVKFIGVGEKIDDLQPFVPEDFVAALFDETEE